MGWVWGLCAKMSDLIGPIKNHKMMWYNYHRFIIFREIAEALDIDAEGSRPEQSNPVNMPSALRHGSVPVRKILNFPALKYTCLI